MIELKIVPLQPHNFCPIICSHICIVLGLPAIDEIFYVRYGGERGQHGTGVPNYSAS